MPSYYRYRPVVSKASAPPLPLPVPSVLPSAPLLTKGLKRALIIGINYTGTQYELAGCINDANNMAAHIKRFFPSCKEQRIITDNTAIKPTRKAILDGIAWLTEGLKAGEHVMFHYSGHGGTVRDTNGDEVSGLDACIYPINGRTLETITDDELRAKLANKIPSGSKCFVILDACHSGTAVDLRCSWEVPTELSLRYEEDKRYEKTSGQVVFLSGCRDDQTSADTVNAESKPCGALTWALLETWKTYGAAIKMKYILWDVHTFLQTRGYSQKPQLSVGQYMDINSVFDLGNA